MKIFSTHQFTKHLKIEWIIIPVFAKFPKEELTSILGSYSIDDHLSLIQEFKGLPGESIHFPPRKGTGTGISLFGLGEVGKVSIKRSTIEFIHQAKKYLPEHIGVSLELTGTDDVQRMIHLAENLTKGIVLAFQNPGKFKTTAKDEKNINSLTWIIPKPFSDPVENASEKGRLKAITISRLIDLINTPASHKTPVELVDWMQSSAQNSGYQIKILDKKELFKQGWHALIAVNRGSEVPAQCVIAEYSPKIAGKYVPKVVLAGKGVTFDTGGLSIKTGDTVHYMKSDMGGAAAVMGTIELAAQLQLQVHIVAILPFTDNSVDARSIKPGDIISSYSGKSIEVINTDAEGRLILADALAYAVKNHPCDYLIDVATLTGNIVLALGNEAAGLMTNNNNLAAQLEKAGIETGEKVWRMPLWDDYKKHLDSDIADIKNLGTKPLAGSITAAKFLEYFTDHHKAYAHLDIAGTSFGTYPISKDYSATGFGVDLLVNWLEHLEK
ncbi:MAG TPA: leucyl aminopeptidase [Saprospiraceae bacterium]|nr:leucyl aminopeptidase [Saprospiraceae bacterium]